VQSLRRAAALLASIAFASQFAVLAAVFGGLTALVRSPRGAVSGVESVLLCSFAVFVARTRPRRVVVAAVAALVVVVQTNVFRYYHTPLDVQVAASAIHAWADVRAVLTSALPSLVVAIALVFAVELALLELVHRAFPALRPRPAHAFALAFAGVLGLPPRAATPEIRAAHALGALADKHEPRAAHAVSLPLLHSERAELPSVLFILSESIRAEDYDAETAPETAALTKGRVDLAQMRSVASYTALSFSALLTGRSQEAERDAILRSPSIFDYARAARDARGQRPTIVYWSSQSREVFETNDLRAPLDRFAAIESFAKDEAEADRLGETGADKIVVAHAERELPALAAGPKLVFLHLIDTHAPYIVEDEHAPFRPYDHSPAWSKMKELHNAYKDAIVTQDRLVARAIRAFVDREQGRPWLVVFTSDHGEAFSEHGAIHHGQNLFEEQVHVPAWIWAGPGALAPAQSQALADYASRYVTHLDLVPTVLDALGLWDNFAVKPHRALLHGRSLLRAPQPMGMVPVTNCTPMFTCPTNTWGLYEEDHKLLARIYDGGWVCFRAGNGEEDLADDETCNALRAESRRIYPLLPNGSPNR
jgi:glucan phosphoethanolaminetransferase (alkaline phosphatase superfamily)